MKLDKKSLLLYAVTDRKWLIDETLEIQVETALKNGVTILQLREKDLDFDKFLSVASKIKKITDYYKIPLIINDSIEVALAIGADGVHLGQKDMDTVDARKKIGKDKILGISVQTIEQAVTAEKIGADYLGVGAVFSTSTKLDAEVLSPILLKQICAAVSLPVVAIGGISKNNLPELKGTGVYGVAVISAIFAQSDIALSTRELRLLAEKIIGHGLDLK